MVLPLKYPAASNTGFGVAVGLAFAAGFAGAALATGLGVAVGFGWAAGADLEYVISDKGESVAADTTTTLSPVLAAVFAQAGLRLGAFRRHQVYARYPLIPIVSVGDSLRSSAQTVTHRITSTDCA